MPNVIQLAVGGFDDNFSYIIHDLASGDTAIVDPCGDIAVMEKELAQLNFVNPTYILVTHSHHDHISGLDAIRRTFNGKVCAHPDSSCAKDIVVKNREKLPFGNISIECLYTPGHTVDGITYHLTDDSAIFTGDTLFIDWCGYCNARTMFKTMREVLFPLAGSNEVYSGHNYGRTPHAPLSEEKLKNPYLYLTDFNEFKQALKDL